MTVLEKIKLFDQLEKNRKRHEFLVYSIKRTNPSLPIAKFLKLFKSELEEKAPLSEHEYNFFRFFEILGQDLSQVPHAYFERTSENIERWNEVAIPNQCHLVANMLLYVHKHLKNNDQLKAFWGFVDTYTEDTYTGIYCHSFLTSHNNGSHMLIDPASTRNRLNRNPDWHSNHYGIYLPYSIIDEVNEIVTNESHNLNYSGYFNDIVFSSTEKN